MMTQARIKSFFNCDTPKKWGKQARTKKGGRHCRSGGGNSGMCFSRESKPPCAGGKRKLQKVRWKKKELSLSSRAFYTCQKCRWVTVIEILHYCCCERKCTCIRMNVPTPPPLWSFEKENNVTKANGCAGTVASEEFLFKIFLWLPPRPAVERAWTSY